MKTSIANTVTVARTEVRSIARLSRFWLLVIVLSAMSMFGYSIACTFEMYASSDSPTLGISTTWNILSSIDQTFFVMYLLAITILAYDVDDRLSKSRVIEVWNSKPVMNFEYLLGRTLGITFLVWLVVASNVMVANTIGLVSQIFELGLSEPFHFSSMITLTFLDTPVLLLFWCSFVVFLRHFLKIRLVVLIVAIALLLGWYWIIGKIPYSLLPVLSPNSANVLFVSDIVPEFPFSSTIATRFAFCLMSFVILVLCSLFSNRGDGTPRLGKVAIGSSLFILSVGVYSLALVLLTLQFSTSEVRKHIGANPERIASVDIEKISGNVRINPGKRLEIKLAMALRLETDLTEKLEFVLNPGLNIREIVLEDHTASFSFHKGLLVVTSNDSLRLNKTYILQIVADGSPYSRFGFFDNAVDYLRDPNVSTKSVFVFGRDASVFENSFVALMPRNYWYPVPKSAIDDLHYSQERDFFEIDLTVEVLDERFDLIGPGVRPIESVSGLSFRWQPPCLLDEIGLIASEFESESVDLDGTILTLFLHKKHARNLRLFEDSDLSDALHSIGISLLRQYTRHGLNLPCSTLSFVEVPSRLRTIDGGWRMDSLSSLPGVVLLKEHGFPTAKLDRVLSLIESRSLDKDALAKEKLELIMRYFNSGLGTDNPWMNVPEVLWSQATSVAGKHSMVLEQIILALISSGSRTPFEFMSVYSTLHIAELLSVNPYRTRVAFARTKLRRNPDYRVFGPWNIEEDFGSREAVWELVERNSLTHPDPSMTDQERLEFVLLKCNEIARGLLSSNRPARVLEWLAGVRNRSMGRTVTLDDLLEAALTHEIRIEPFLTDWLQSSELPGYITSLAAIERVQIEADESSQQQLSVIVKNTESVAGVVKLRYTHPNSSDGYIETPEVAISAGSAKRISLLSPDTLREIEIVPGLSLNRRTFALPVGNDFSDQLHRVEPMPFEQEVRWEPEQIGVVIDDLDPGFQVFQRGPRLNRTASVGPLAWLEVPKLDLSLDVGLPSASSVWYYRVPQGVWRREYDEHAFGRFRKTQASVLMRDSVPTASFSVSLPESGTWKLEYHVATPRRGKWFEDQNYVLEIFNAEESIVSTLNVEEWWRGWNTIGKYDLTKGNVSVNIIGVSNPSHRVGTIYADAIRWSQSGRPDAPR